MTINAILDTKGREVVSAAPDMLVGEIVRIFAEQRIGAVPVIEEDEVIGIMSERDLVHCIAEQGAAALDLSVREVMTSPPITVEIDHSVLGALGLMTRRRVRHLPVIDGERIVGFVSIGDLVKFRMDKIEQDAEAMRDYIRSA